MEKNVYLIINSVTQEPDTVCLTESVRNTVFDSIPLSERKRLYLIKTNGVLSWK